jgi:hypothetical protein
VFPPQGIQTMVLRGDGGSEFVEQNPDDKGSYIVLASRNKGGLCLNCTTNDVAIAKNVFAKTTKRYSQ